jgi:hypothetical protein
LDLVQRALQQVQEALGLRIDRMGTPIGIDGHQHTTERIIDLVRDPGGDPPDRRQTLGLDHLLLQGFLLGERREHRRELPPEAPDLAVAVGQGALHPARILPPDASHAVGQLHQRPDHASPPEPADRQQDRQDRAGHQDAAEEDLAKPGQIGRVGEQGNELADLGAVTVKRQAQHAADIVAIDRRHASGRLVDHLRLCLREPRQGVLDRLIQAEAARAVARKDPARLVEQDPDRIAAAIRTAQKRVGQPDIVVAQRLDLHAGHRVPEGQGVAALILAQIGQGLQTQRNGHRECGRHGCNTQTQRQTQPIARQRKGHAPFPPVKRPAIRAMSS